MSRSAGGRNTIIHNPHSNTQLWIRNPECMWWQAVQYLNMPLQPIEKDFFDVSLKTKGIIPFITLCTWYGLGPWESI